MFHMHSEGDLAALLVFMTQHVQLSRGSDVQYMSHSRYFSTDAVPMFASRTVNETLPFYWPGRLSSPRAPFPLCDRCSAALKSADMTDARRRMFHGLMKVSAFRLVFINSTCLVL